jgi:hypothetical protein
LLLISVYISCSTSRDASTVLIGSISCLDWTTELAGAKLAMYIWLNERIWKLPELSGEKMPVQYLEHMKQSKQEGLKLFPCLRDSAASSWYKKSGSKSYISWRPCFSFYFSDLNSPANTRSDGAERLGFWEAREI